MSGYEEGEREDQKVLDAKKQIERIFPGWGTDYEETISDLEGNNWGVISVSRCFYVNEKTGKITTVNPESGAVTDDINDTSDVDGHGYYVNG